MSTLGVLGLASLRASLINVDIDGGWAEAQWAMDPSLH